MTTPATAKYSATTPASSTAITSASSSVLVGVVASGTTGIAPCACTTNRRATTNSLEPPCFSFVPCVCGYSEWRG
ncbi:hypothetical protein PI124_g2688 [Phytophthora idaei]|nr:hypothetical protein PI125_g12599 [Phytophthora idaei]KAG3144404.1 hypothetical protein PI126_g14178 [Phytophthora idaei]KAG3252761.1 hypothetical protein PI124_g2688 [Phytophthora idaei]